MTTAFAEPIETTLTTADRETLSAVVEGRGLFRDPTRFVDDISILAARSAEAVGRAAGSASTSDVTSWKPVESIRYEVDVIPEGDGRPLRQFVADARDPMEACASVAWRMAHATHPKNRPLRNFERILRDYSFQAHRRDFADDGVEVLERLGRPSSASIEPGTSTLLVDFASNDGTISGMDLRYSTTDVPDTAEELLDRAMDTVCRRFVSHDAFDHDERMLGTASSLSLSRVGHSGPGMAEAVGWWRTDSGVVAQGRVPSGYAASPVEARISLALETVGKDGYGRRAIASTADVADRIDIDGGTVTFRTRPPAEVRDRVRNAAAAVSHAETSTDAEVAYARSVLAALDRTPRRMDPRFLRPGRIRQSQLLENSPSVDPRSVAGDYAVEGRRPSPHLDEPEPGVAGPRF